MIATYCNRETAVQAIQWQPGGQKQIADLVTWGAQVKPVEDHLILQTPDLVERVQPGDYIVRVSNDSFYRFTPEEFREHYARVEAQAV